ncbi:MAG: ABC transporter substrate-binding protein [Lachnospiraceae bacterium]
MRKQIVYAVCLCAGIALLTGCKGNLSTSFSQSEASVTFTDALGSEISVERPKKVAVLSGSLADAWLLAGGKLAAATEDAKETIQWTQEITSLGALKSPNIERMVAEDIDLAILSSTIAEHVDIRETLEQAGIRTAYFDVETFEDYAAMMDILTTITGRKDLYQEHVEAVRTEIAAQLKRADTSEPSVLFLRAYSTGVRAKGSDSMTGQMLKDLGCINIADSDGRLLDDLSMEAIIEADPDFVFLTTMGESQKDALQMAETLLLSNPAWSGLKAVRDGHYFVLPKELFHNKPNERWGESYQILADDLYGKK